NPSRRHKEGAYYRVVAVIVDPHRTRVGGDAEPQEARQGRVQVVGEVVLVVAAAVGDVGQVDRRPLRRLGVDGQARESRGGGADVAGQVFERGRDGVGPVGERLDSHFPGADAVVGNAVGVVGTDPALAHEDAVGEDADDGVHLAGAAEGRRVDVGDVVGTGTARAAGAITRGQQVGGARGRRGV